MSQFEVSSAAKVHILTLYKNRIGHVNVLISSWNTCPRMKCVTNGPRPMGSHELQEIVCSGHCGNDQGRKLYSPVVGAEQPRLLVHVRDRTEIPAYDLKIGVMADVVAGHFEHPEVEIGDRAKRTAGN
jgi:hypothetical protein